MVQQNVVPIIVKVGAGGRLGQLDFMRARSEVESQLVFCLPFLTLCRVQYSLVVLLSDSVFAEH